MTTSEAAAQRIDKVAEGQDHLDADQQSAAILRCKRVIVPIVGPAGGAVVRVEEAALRRQQLVPIADLAEAGAQRHDLRSSRPLGRNGGLLDPGRIPLPVQTIAGSHQAVREAGLPGAAATGGRMHGVRMRGHRPDLGDRTEAPPSGRTAAVRDLPEAVLPGVDLAEPRIGASAHGIVPSAVVQRGVAALRP